MHKHWRDSINDLKRVGMIILKHLKALKEK